ncbi:TauD/TfdA family dioxygenase [Pleionea sp. CnH1-48]|uniref:TauD/TfdA family dioxygenase n=1 Tax=Pleionea sp. CnH1-48 TaxID=2954494 RepID=UPI00209747DF|nr:TauD/TfdA family dioxygenase [Pleionea sp. CnH1-48]MCO7226515.1 TauD/TfdA family dioxygenase [Pleionea sp. CnH1-48]
MNTTTTNEVVLDIEKYFFDEESKLPIVHEARCSSENLEHYYTNNKANIKSDLLEYGAVLFRNFDVRTLDAFDEFVGCVIDKVAPYLGGATPRKTLTKSVSTSTEFPREQEIKLHNELSYERFVPPSLMFCCLKEPETGGQTQIADVNKVFGYIDPEIIEAFEKHKGWKLIRNFGMGFGPTVADGFGTTDLDVIKQDCQSRDVDLQIIKDDLVRTTHVRDAVSAHPVSGLPLWLNHIVFWHPSSLSSDYRAYMSQAFSPEEFPYNTFFADGETIPDEYAENIREAYRRAEVTFDWRPGDVLLVDNYRVAHGRKPFTGERLIVVSMG